MIPALRFQVHAGLRPARFAFIDLFAGIGGFRKAFAQVGGKCVFSCEVDRFAREMYSANFNTTRHPFSGDIFDVDACEVPPHDVLLAGFPCPPFSIAGISKRNSLGREHGFEDKKQGLLFFEIARLLRHHRPKAFLLENVKNLLSHDKGRTFETMLGVLEEELGYTVHYKVVNARGFVPQNRARVFIAGFREEQSFDFGLVKPLSGRQPVLGDILHPEDGSEPVEPRFTEGPLARVRGKFYVTPGYWQYMQEYAAKHRAKGNGFGYGLFGPGDTARTLLSRYYKDGSEILVETGGATPRKLTPRECSRLMGFDRPGEACFRIPVSNTQAYRLFGNAVVVPVVEAIARLIEEKIHSGSAGGEAAPDDVARTAVQAGTL